MSILSTTEQELKSYFKDFKNSEDFIKTKRQAKREATTAKIKRAKLQCQRMFKGYDHNNPESSAKTTICWEINEAIIKYWNDKNSDKAIKEVTEDAFKDWKGTNKECPFSWDSFRKTFKKAYDHFNNENADTKKRCREQIWKEGSLKKLTMTNVRSWKVSEAGPLTQIAVASTKTRRRRGKTKIGSKK